MQYRCLYVCNMKGNCRGEEERCISWQTTSSSNLICFPQTDIWKIWLVRKDLNQERWVLECRKIVSTTAYIAGIVTVTVTGQERGSLNCMTELWMGKALNEQKREQLKQSPNDYIQRHRMCLSEQIVPQRLDRLYWNFSFEVKAWKCTPWKCAQLSILQ